MVYNIRRVNLLYSVFFSAEGLKCWKCIAHDCEMDPSENYKASKVQCQDGQSCMVRYCL